MAACKSFLCLDIKCPILKTQLIVLVCFQSSEFYVIEIPSNEHGYCKWTLKQLRMELQAMGVITARNRSEDVNEEDGDHQKLENPRELLVDFVKRQYPDTPGWTLVLSDPDVVKGRFFVVIDGNHRLAALKLVSGQDLIAKAPWITDLTVRMAVLPMDSLLELLAMGSLLNKIRGVQADDIFVAKEGESHRGRRVSRPRQQLLGYPPLA